MQQQKASRLTRELDGYQGFVPTTHMDSLSILTKPLPDP